VGSRSESCVYRSNGVNIEVVSIGQMGLILKLGQIGLYGLILKLGQIGLYGFWNDSSPAQLTTGV
jgi:hypothetical protein